MQTTPGMYLNMYARMKRIFDLFGSREIVLLFVIYDYVVGRPTISIHARDFGYRVEPALSFLVMGKRILIVPPFQGQKKIQLWHGIPLKKIEHDNKLKDFSQNRQLEAVKRLLSEKILNNALLFPFIAEKWDVITSTSPLISERMATAYNNTRSEIKITGYPRNDALLSPKFETLLIIKKIVTQCTIKKFILYAPTFRNKYDDNISLFNGLNVVELDKCLSRFNAIMFVKMHPIFKGSMDLLDTAQDRTRIYWLKDEDIKEINELLPYIDILITDYSGVYIDYLLLNRPIIFTPFDIQQYISKDRELYEDYQDATPGVKCTNWGEVMKSIETIFTGVDDYDLERMKAVKKYHTYTDANSSKRVVEVARGLLK